MTPIALSLLPIACVGLSLMPDEAAGPDLPDAPLRAPWPGVDDDNPGPDTGDTGQGGGDPGEGGGDPGETPAASPLAGLTLWVDPDSNAARDAADADADEAALFWKLADQPVAKWLGEWSGDVGATVEDAVDAAETDGAIRAFVVYNLPNRDCGGYSGGGADDADSYAAWIDDIAGGLAGRSAIVILEPDGLSMMDCLSGADADERYALLRYAARSLRAAGAFVYLDAGHSAWHATDEMASRLRLADVGAADGFALNTSNFETTADLVAYGEDISAATDGARFILDTSRNGLGPTADHQWCNPDGRALGEPPSLAPEIALADALLWVKAPGESDGSCNGGPSAGTWWPEYALGLAERATW
jgi:endoglucanase